MTLNIEALVIVVAYLVGMLLVGFVVGKLHIKNSTDYMLAGRRMGIFMVAFSLAANNVGGGSTTGLAQRAYGDWGISAIWYVLAASLAMIPLAYFAPRIRKTMAVTIPEVVGRRFGTTSSTLTAILSAVSLFCLTSSQIAASGSVVSTLTGLPVNVSLIIAGGVVILYTTFGGMIADQISDLIQFVVILLGLAIATPFVIEGCGGWDTIAAALPPVQLDFAKIGWITIIGYVFNYFCTFLAGPEMVSRFESAKDEKTARGAAWLSAVLMALMSVFPALLGLAALATMPDLPSAGASAMMEVTTTHAPGVIAGLISAAIICATMSSADSNLLCMSTIIMNDLYLKFGGKNLHDKQLVLYTRLCNAGAAIIAMIIAMAGVPIIIMNTFAFGIRCAGPFAAYGLGLVVPRATRNSGIFSLVGGTIGFIVWQVLSGGGFLFGILPVVFGCAVSTVVFFGVNAIEWRRNVPPAPSAYLEEGKPRAELQA